jgi:hypothetical protein
MACAAVLVISAAALHYYGVSAAHIAGFAAYSGLAITLPGTMLWRAMSGRPHHIGVDASLGTAVGFAVEIPVYLLARTLDVPLAVVAWPAATIAVFALTPSLRRHWRGSGERMPVGVSCGLSVFMLYVLATAALSIWRVEGLTGRLADAPYPDEPFQTALVGELKHHFPAVMPFVSGTPLQYHWYFHAHGAAASWITGIEPQVLLLRLLPLPLMYMTGVLMVAIGRSLTGKWWPGLLALGLSLFGTIASPYQWSQSPFATGSVLDAAWYSPTQAFGAALFAALVYVLLDFLRSREPAPSGRRIGPWIALVVLTGAVAGAKATFLPMLVCGLVLMVLVRFVVSRRIDRALGAAGITVVWLGFAQFGLYGGGDQGMVVAPLFDVKSTTAGQAALGPPTPSDHWGALLVLALLTLVSWAPGLAGTIGLARRSAQRDPSIWLLVGIGVSGAGALFAFGHPGLSELFFVRSAEPYLALLAACGFAFLVSDRGGAPPRLAWASHRDRVSVGVAAFALALGVAAAYTIRATVGQAKPAGLATLWQITEPFVVLGAVLVAMAAILVALSRQGGRRAVLGAIAVLLMAVALPSGLAGPQSLITAASHGKLRNVKGFAYLTPSGGIKAARWLRDHSDPDDLVATNDHCLPTSITSCDSRDFWVAAYAERRVLVEGWSYTDRAMESLPLYDNGLGTAPYWDPALLAANDAVFQDPGAANVSEMVNRYHVRWLVAVGPWVNPGLSRYATLRYSAAQVSIYQLSVAR